MLLRDHNHIETGKLGPTITFLSADLGKGGAATNIIIQKGWEAGIDVLLLQES